jgi:CheY-like chemotaxis protein
MNSAVRILMADDDPEDRMIMEESFNEIELAHVIHFVEDGEKLILWLDEVEAGTSLPSLIVLDLNMPRMNGTQTLKALKNNSRYKNIPVIIFSTSVNIIEMDECLKIGAVSYVVKPVTYKDCLQTARSFYDFSMGSTVV